MHTSELAASAGVNPQTLRYYERRGLLEAPPRSAGGYRDYPPATVGRLRFVKRVQKLGFSLAEIEELLLLADGGEGSCDHVRPVAERRAAELDRRIADLRRMRRSLGELLATCELPGAERRCPLLAAIEETRR